MAPRMVCCSMIYLIWSFICRSEYDVSVHQHKYKYGFKTKPTTSMVTNYPDVTTNTVGLEAKQKTINT